jgi:hypothetical protein
MLSDEVSIFIGVLQHKVDIISSKEPIVTLIDSKDYSTNRAG